MRDDPASRPARFYDDLWANQWSAVAQRSPLRSARERLILSALRPRLRPGATLLDVGSGDGHFLGLLRSRYPAMSIAGVDFSATARLSAPEDVQALITVGDVGDLPSVFPGRTFDLVTCSEVLEHVEDPLRVIRGIAAVLAREGTGVITVPGGMRYWSSLDEAAGHLRRFEYEELPRLVKTAGLRVLRHQTWGAGLGRIYYGLVRGLGAERTAASAHSAIGAVGGRVIDVLLRVDDFIPSRHGFQLVTVVGHA